MRAAAALLAICFSAAGAVPKSSDDILREHLWDCVRRLPPGERPKVGLVLSAGSVRGLAHVGVLQVLDDSGFPVDAVAGASMGAIVGSVYAGGLPPAFLDAFEKALAKGARKLLSNARILRLIISEDLIPTESIESLISDFIGEKRFDQLPKPFACVAMDIRTGEKIVMQEGPLAPAVRASMSIPGLFKPMPYRHRLLVDGGVVDYIPTDLVRLLGAQWVLASVTDNDFTRTSPSNILQTLTQVIDIRGGLLSRSQRRDADFVIDVKFDDVNFLDFDRADEMAETGALAAKQALPRAKEKFIFACLPSLWKLWTRKP
jgi:NTE family protein